MLRSCADAQWFLRGHGHEDVSQYCLLRASPAVAFLGGISFVTWGLPAKKIDWERKNFHSLRPRARPRPRPSCACRRALPVTHWSRQQKQQRPPRFRRSAAAPSSAIRPEATAQGSGPERSANTRSGSRQLAALGLQPRGNEERRASRRGGQAGAARRPRGFGRAARVVRGRLEQRVGDVAGGEGLGGDLDGAVLAGRVEEEEGVAELDGDGLGPPHVHVRLGGRRHPPRVQTAHLVLSGGAPVHGDAQHQRQSR